MNLGEPMVGHVRGRNLKGDGISEKCQVGRHKECSAARCQCECLHGQISSLMDAVTDRDENNKRRLALLDIITRERTRPVPTASRKENDFYEDGGFAALGGNFIRRGSGGNRANQWTIR